MFLSTGGAVHFGEHTISAAVSGMPTLQAGSGWWRQISGALTLLSLGWLTRSGRKLARTERLLEDETRLCRELNAYLMLDLCPEGMAQQEFARMLCRTVATRSCFARAALLLQEPAGGLRVAGSAGVDDVAVMALNRWGATAGNEGQGGRFLLHLERRAASREGAGRMRCANMHAIPMRSTKGLLGF